MTPAPGRTADNARGHSVPENETAKKIRHEIAMAGLCGFDSLDQIRGLLSDAASKVEKLAEEAAQLRSRLLEAEQGAEAMRERAAACAANPDAWAYQWEGQATYLAAAAAIRDLPLNPNREAGDHEPR